jgi:phosphoribosyl-AMP cyclohydrolase
VLADKIKSLPKLPKGADHAGRLSCTRTNERTGCTTTALASDPCAGYAKRTLKNLYDAIAMSDLAPDFSKGDGLLPVIAQDADTGEVLMLAYMNAESFARTRETGEAHYYSRSRRRLWKKGEESGHTQQVKSMLVDCDGDTILLKVTQRGGAACHEGYRSCFFRELTDAGLNVIGQRVFDPAKVYVKGSGTQRVPGVQGSGKDETTGR